MARLFIGHKEISLMSDITKEIIKDQIGQYIIYYPVSTLKTQVHPIYDEAIEKIFESPIKLDALVGQPNWETKYNQFGNEQVNKLEVFVQARDMLDKGFEIREGDFFVYNDNAFEIISAIDINNFFGMAEYGVGYKIEGKLARTGQFDLNYLKQILADNNSSFADSSTQKVFEQQRGLPTTETEGATNDHREVRERLKDEFAEIALGEGPRKTKVSDDNSSSEFDHDSMYKIYEE